jgi:hypothetical protein
MIARVAHSATIGALAACALLGVLSGCGASASSSTPTGANHSGAVGASGRPAAAESQGTAAAPAGGAGGSTLPPFFNALSPWNTPVTALPADPRSQGMLALAALRPVGAEAPGRQGAPGTVDAAGAGLYINTTSWAPTIVTEQGGVPTKLFCRQVLCGPAAASLSTALVPPSVNPDPRYEGWFTIIDRSEGVAYDLWRARRQADGSISYQYAKRWELNGPGFSRPESVDPQGAVGARGSGLPLFAGAILPGELRAGAIHHALAIAVPGAARAAYVQPASTTDGVGPEDSLPEGARIRLKPGVHLTGLAGGQLRYANVVLEALKKYGAIVVDRATVPTLYAQRDAVSGLLSGGDLSSLRLADFEVVRLPVLLHVTTEGAAGGLSADAQTGAVG